MNVGVESSTTREDYHTFLLAKVDFATTFGFSIDDNDIHPSLLPHQRAVVRWAVHGGRRALFESFGLGKTRQQLEILRLTLAHAGLDKALVVCPLGVRTEFAREAAEIGQAVTFIRTPAGIDGPGIYVTNYESVRDRKLDPNLFDAVSLDEASVLRSFGSLTYQTFLTLFDQVPYRFVATATPSPNRYKELIHYAGFLGVMQTGEALTRFFQRDSTKANNLTLYPHKRREFWLWLNTWACFIQKPSDLGFDDAGYDLPDLNVTYHEVDVDHTQTTVDRDGQAFLFRGGALGVKDVAREKRDTLVDRVTKAMEIVTGYATAVSVAEGRLSDQIIIWVDLNTEQDAIEVALASAGLTFSSVHGGLSLEECERRLEQWRARGTYALVGKPVMLGQGMNLQQCNKAVYVGVTYKFNDVIQSAHRIQRYGQTRPCHAHIIHAESEREVVRTLQAKWVQHGELTSTMTAVIKEHGLDPARTSDALTRSIGVERGEASGQSWLLAHNDCVPETAAMDDASVDLIVTSIPFSNHYEYTPCYDEVTEVLTRRSWLPFGQLTLADECATVNPVTLELEWQHPTSLVWRRYNGPMLHFSQRNSFDLMVTPDHRMFVDRRVGNRKTGRKEHRFELVRAEEIARLYANRKWVMTATVTPGKGAWPEMVQIPQVDHRASERPQVTQIATTDFMELAGWYLSEGCVGKPPIAATCDRCGNPAKADARWCTAYCRARAAVDRKQGNGSAEYQRRIAPRRRQRTSGKRGVICISQYRNVHPDHWQQIVRMWQRIGVLARATERCIDVWDINLATFLRDEFGSGSHNERIPRWVKDLDPQLLCILRDTMMKGDGSATGYAYTSVSDQLRDDFQEICLLTGWRSEVVRHGTAKGRVVNIGRTNVYPEIRTPPVEHPYSGMIGCATVANHTLIVRRNGCAIVSGNSYNDFGHTDDNTHFWAQMDYLTPQLLRVLRPGRMYCCHVKDRILFGSVTGAGVPTVSPFHAEAIMHGRRHGFDYLGMITVVTDVVRENNQTYRLGWSEQCKDGTKMGVGSPEYVLLFRKPQTDRTRGYADVPVTKDKAAYTRSRWQVDAHAFWRSSGNRHLTPDELAALPGDQMSRLFTDQTLHQVYDHEAHVRTGEVLDERGALPATFMSLAPGSHHPDVWHDINRINTLNTQQSRRAQQFHVCLARDSLVLTRNGYTPIQEVSVGEQVLTHRGRWRPVLAVQNTGVRSAVTIKAQGIPGLTLTPDHKVWTRDVRRYARKSEYAREVEPSWVDASETVGSYVNQKLAPVEAPSTIDRRYWWTVGRWLADGHIDKRGCAVLSIGATKLNGTLDMLGAYAGNTPRKTNESCHQLQLRDPGYELRRTLKACGHGAAYKQLPPEAYTLPVDMARAVLDGYLSGDGHYRLDRNRWMASSVSRELLLGMSMLAQRAYGAVASLYAGRSDRRGLIQGRDVHMSAGWAFCFDVLGPDRRQEKLIFDDGAWKKVRVIEPAGQVETWNLRVAEDESYTAEGCIVKNCPLQVDVVERLVRRYSNEGDLVFDPFAGIGTVPLVSLRLGRRGRGVELNPDYWRDSVHYLRAQEREANMPTLFDLTGDAS